MSDRSDHEVAARLATEAGKLLLGVRDELADASADERKAAGDKRSHDFLMAALTAERPDDAVLSEEGADDPVRLTLRAGVDRRPARRHPRVLRARPRRLGGACRALGSRRTGRRRGRLPAQGITLATPDVAAPPQAPATPRIVVSRTRPPAIALEVSDALTARSSRWARPEPKSRPSCRVSPTSTCMRADSMNGTRLHRSRWPAPPGCTRLASTAHRWSTTSAIRCCRT